MRPLMIQLNISMFLRKLNFLKKLQKNEFHTSYTLMKEAAFDIKTPFKMHLLEKGPDTKVMLTSEDAIKMFKQMSSIRRMENTASNLYKSKNIRGFCHLYSGQEGVAVGMFAAMRPGDAVTTSYRSHAWVWLFGQPYESVLGELCGRVTGCSRGKGGSMHTYSKDFYGGNGIVGAQVPLAAGVGLACKYFNKGCVSFGLYGDGAANQGQIFEAYNIAKLWSLPVVFVCENNKYGMGTSIQRASASTDFYTRAHYIPGLQVDGMDVLASREATLFAIAHCLAGKGPILLEMITYRYFGHSMSDPGTSYRSRDEVQQVRQTQDPINLFKAKIVEANLTTEDELKAADEGIKNEVDASKKKVLASPVTPPQELCADVSKNNLEPYIRGTVAWAKHKHVNVAK